MPVKYLLTHSLQCGHIFCKECIESYIHGRTATSGIVEDFLSCPSCDRLFETVTPVNPPSSSSNLQPDSTSPSAARSRTGTPGSRSKKYKDTHKGTKGKDASGFEPHTMYSSWLERSDTNPDEFPLTASAKTTALKAILLRGFTEAPFDKVCFPLFHNPSPLGLDPILIRSNDFGILVLIWVKVVIYVQFRQLARIVGRICQSEGWPFLYLTGDRPLDDRSKIIARFRDDKNIKILVAGLKCGGLGYVCFSLIPNSMMPSSIDN